MTLPMKLFIGANEMVLLMFMFKRDRHFRLDKMNIRFIFVLRTRVCCGNDWSFFTSPMEDEFGIVEFHVRFSDKVIQNFLAEVNLCNFRVVTLVSAC